VRKSRKVYDKGNDENIEEFQATVVVKNAPPAYKDPLLMTKLAKLKQMQATRHSTNQNDLTERARYYFALAELNSHPLFYSFLLLSFEY
jgi:hypothetical protein